MIRRKKRSRAAELLPMVAVFAVLLAVGLIGVWLWGGTAEPADGPVTSDPPTTTTATVTTTATTTTTTTMSTVTTTTAAPTTTATQAAGGGTTTLPLLQYDTAGRYVQPAGAAWNLTLVNDWNPVPAAYESTVSLVRVGNMGQRVDARVQQQLTAMLAAGAANGIDVVSGYRPASQQATIYWRRVNQYRSQGYDADTAQRMTGSIIKRPGYSEHNCGLAVDLGGNGNFRLEEDFQHTAAYKWLIANCAEYGFILRYPQGKEDITGVTFEPWHYRYVGVDAAREIMKSGVCLEEYLRDAQ